MNDQNPVIETQNLTKTYRMGAADVLALRGWTCASAPATSWRSWDHRSGKSTMMHLLAAWTHPPPAAICWRDAMSVLFGAGAGEGAQPAHWLHLSDFQPSPAPDRWTNGAAVALSGGRGTGR